MRIIHFFRKSLIGQLTLVTLLALTALLTAVSVWTGRAYQRDMRGKLLELEAKNLVLESESLRQRTRPYVNYLYAAATDPELVELAHALSVPESGDAALRLRVAFREMALSERCLRGLSAIYEDGSCVAYKKAERVSSFDAESGRETRARLFREASGSRTPVSEYWPEEHQVYVAVPAISVRHPRGESRACFLLALDLSFLEEDLRADETGSARSYLVDAKGTVMLGPDGSAAQNIGEVPEAAGGGEPLRMRVNTLGWEMCMFVDRAELGARLSRALAWGASRYVPVAALAALVVLMLTRWMLRPLGRLNAAMERAGGGDLQVRVSVEGSNELWQLTGGFNRMMEQLEGYYETNSRYYQRLLEMERKTNQAEMAMLESHINAHFLFNTLNAINFQALEAGNQEVSRSIRRLANIMRYAFNSRLENVRLFQEASWVEQYLELLKDRMGERLSYEVSVDDDVADWPFRKMMLQPFVENAVLHGIQPDGSGVILVIAHGLPDGRLMVTVSDDGRGMDPARAERVRRILRNPRLDEGLGGIGLSNVAERIYAFFGPEAEILLDTRPGAGSKFILKLPLPSGRELEYGFLDEEEDESNEIL